MVKFVPINKGINPLELRVGEIIAIESRMFEVIYTQQEADMLLPGDTEIISYLAIYLHELSSSELHPTSMLRYYTKSSKIHYLDLIYDNRADKTAMPKTNGVVILFKNQKEVDLKDIRQVKSFTKPR